MLLVDALCHALAGAGESYLFMAAERTVIFAFCVEIFVI